MRIQLLTFQGCAHAAAARDLLTRVLASSKAEDAFEEVDTHAANTPEPYRSYASPTILVDGEAIGGGGALQGNCCRLYLDDHGRLVGLPSEAALRSALDRAARPPRAAAT
jgi:glutaredoxin